MSISNTQPLFIPRPYLSAIAKEYLDRALLKTINTTIPSERLSRDLKKVLRTGTDFIELDNTHPPSPQ
jgi:hypothetical protein